MLSDRFGRNHDSLRVSVTDRCNIRCFYCMPLENVSFLPRTELLSFEEIERFVSVATELGIRKIRLTGGEPLVRQQLDRLIAALRRNPMIQDLALTTNGLLLGEQAEALFAAGLQRLNVSLDSLRPEIFRQISRRDGLPQVLSGIAAAQRAGFRNIRINAVSLAGITEPDIVPLAQFCREQQLELRFIEFMPLDADHGWSPQQVLTGARVRAMIESTIGALSPASRPDPSQPAVDYDYRDGGGRVGFINPVSEPFCGDCNRMRITAEGKIRNCLFSTTEWDARAILRGGGSDQELADLIRDCIDNKKAGHGINDPQFLRPARAMFQIGG